MPLALIHAKRLRNSLSCEQIIGRGGLEVRIQVGNRPRVLNCVIGECLMEDLFDRDYVRAAPGSPQNPQLQRPGLEEVA